MDKEATAVMVALGVWVAMVAEAATAQIVPVLRAAQAAAELVVPLVPAGLAVMAATAKTAELGGPVDQSYSLILPATLVRFRRPLMEGRVVLAVTVETRVLARAQAPQARVAME